jgi:hypothetical protein
MKKIKDLQSRVKEYLLDIEAKYIEDKRVDSFLKKIEKRFPKLHDRLQKAIGKRRIVKWTRVKDELLSALTLEGMQRKTVETVINNTLKYLCWRFEHPKAVSTNETSISIPLMLATALRTIINITNTVGKFASVQAMPNPTCHGMRLEVNEGEASGHSYTSLTGEPTPRVSYKVEQKTVLLSAQSQKLAVGWTIDTMQDLKAFHGLDVEAEISKAIAEETTHEAVTNVLAQIKAESPVVELDFHPDTMFGPSDGLGVPNLFAQMHKFGVAVTKVANEIGADTRRGAANVIICSPITVALLQTCGKYFVGPTESEKAKDGHQYTLRFAGTLDGTIKVYCTMCFGAEDDGFIIGYRGTDMEWDAGMIYAPYMPLMPSGVVMNPVTFQPAVTMYSRADQKLEAPHYYRYLKFTA